MGGSRCLHMGKLSVEAEIDTKLMNTILDGITGLLKRAQWAPLVAWPFFL